MAPGAPGRHRPGAAGGIRGLGVVEQAARLDSLGLDGDRYLTTTDPTERLVLLVRAEHVEERLDQRDRNAAVYIVDQLVKAINRGG